MITSLKVVNLFITYLLAYNLSFISQYPYYKLLLFIFYYRQFRISIAFFVTLPFTYLPIYYLSFIFRYPCYKLLLKVTIDNFTFPLSFFFLLLLFVTLPCTYLPAYNSSFIFQHHLSFVLQYPSYKLSLFKVYYR